MKWQTIYEMRGRGMRKTEDVWFGIGKMVFYYAPQKTIHFYFPLVLELNFQLNIKGNSETINYI